MFDINKKITERIIEKLNEGVIPWKQPWHMNSKALSRVTGKPYSFLNHCMLSGPGEYATFNRIKEENGRVLKGEHGQLVFLWKPIEKAEINEETGEIETKIKWFLRYYTVFNIITQTDLEPKYWTPPEEKKHPEKRKANKILKDYIGRENIKLREDGTSAFYSPSEDKIVIPPKKYFDQVEEYYSTKFHEVVHSTGAKNRLARDFGGGFGSTKYSKEELVAEIGAAALLNHVGIETTSSFENSTAYIQSWLKVLKDDQNMIVQATGKAEKAFEYIIGGTK